MRIRHLTSRERNCSGGKGSWSESYYLLIFQVHTFTDLDIKKTVLLLTMIQNILTSCFSICTWSNTYSSNSIMPVISTTMEADIGYLLLLTLYSRGLMPCLSDKWQDFNKCSLSEQNGFCDRLFKSLLLKIARVVSTASPTLAEDQTKAQSNPSTH